MTFKSILSRCVFLSLAAVALAVATTAALSAAAPASALTAARRVPITVNLTDGATMTAPLVAGDMVAFDLTVPSLSDGSYVTAVAWNTSDAYWEIVVDSTSIYVQWARGPQTGLNASVVPVDDSRPHHIRLDTRGPKLTVDGADAVIVLKAPAAAPMVDLIVNPISH